MVVPGRNNHWFKPLNLPRIKYTCLLRLHRNTYTNTQTHICMYMYHYYGERRFRRDGHIYSYVRIYCVTRAPESSPASAVRELSVFGRQRRSRDARVIRIRAGVSRDEKRLNPVEHDRYKSALTPPPVIYTASIAPRRSDVFIIISYCYTSYYPVYFAGVYTRTRTHNSSVTN